MRKRRIAANSREGESAIPRSVRLGRRIIGYKRVLGTEPLSLAANFLFARQIGIGAAVTRRPPSRPGELHPEPLTEPDVNLSAYPAGATPERLPPCSKTVSSSGFPLTQSRRG